MVAWGKSRNDSEIGEGRVDLDLPEIDFGIENKNFKKNGIEIVGIKKCCHWRNGSKHHYKNLSSQAVKVNLK